MKRIKYVKKDIIVMVRTKTQIKNIYLKSHFKIPPKEFPLNDTVSKTENYESEGYRFNKR